MRDEEGEEVCTVYTINFKPSEYIVYVCVVSYMYSEGSEMYV